MLVTAVNAKARYVGIENGMAVADARAIIPGLQVMDDKPDLPGRLLKKIAEWCIRFAPIASIDLPNGIVLDASGCPHLWGGDKKYLEEVIRRLKERGYAVRAAMADTIGAAWAVARFGESSVVEPGMQAEAILSLPPASLRLEPAIVEQLYKLGLRYVKDFIGMPRTALRRRFGAALLKRIDQALGSEDEILLPVWPPEPYQERLPCLEPIVTAAGIEIALQQLLQRICARLRQEEKGLRAACLKCYRVDGKIVEVVISTNHPTHQVDHLFKLFELRISSIEPAAGIELFTLDASRVEEQLPYQEKIWENSCGLHNPGLLELLDRITGKLGDGTVHRYLPAAHYWPERSCKPVASMTEMPAVDWKLDRPRPLQLLARPEPIRVTAPIPDYPPMLFHYKGKIHKVIKADGPERIEQEWWLQEGLHRDYYCVEDESGCRYWLFRSGHYDEEATAEWFIHGFFS
jgi:protein ImuB